MGATTSLLLIGCGKMGGAILQRIAGTGLASTICVIEPTPLPAHDPYPKSVQWLSAPEKLDPHFTPDIVILAVKPQAMATVLPAYARFKQAVFLSIAAGVTLARLGTLLQNPAQAIIRAMPNLPASIGEGISVAVANSHVSTAQHALGDSILKTVGEALWVEDEAMLDAVTALSGSGPSYLFALCETMTKAGEALGLTPDMAARLARKTLTGSGALLAQSPDSAEALRRAVTSPGGTTEAALKHLLADNGLLALMQKAMTAAAERAKELAQQGSWIG